MPWHANRNELGEVVNWFAKVASSRITPLTSAPTQLQDPLPSPPNLYVNGLQFPPPN